MFSVSLSGMGANLRTDRDGRNPATEFRLDQCRLWITSGRMGGLDAAPLPPHIAGVCINRIGTDRFFSPLVGGTTKMRIAFKSAAAG